MANRQDRENTQKAIRRKVENAMNLETGALDGQEYKDAVKDVVQDYIVCRRCF